MKKLGFLFALALISLLCMPVFASDASLVATYDSGVVTVTGDGFDLSKKYLLRVVNTEESYVVTLENAIGSVSMDVKTGELDGAVEEDYWVYANYWEDGTLVAKCPITIAEISSVTVSFDTNGGSTLDPLVTQPGIISLPGDPTKSGSTFAGWYTDSALSIQFSAQTPVNSDITLYAKWNVEEVFFNIQSTLSANNKLKKGKTLQIVPLTNLKTPVLYFSSKTSVATVSASGVVKAINTGSVTITVTTTYEGKVYTYKFNVAVTAT
ncbi:MAG: InlB B-repeat-containing protein [Clostridiales bacterium]|jgi:uncharacterized repeat protein (TIGR02543 family)|nr:InlB B-repeat-containing protein [Clostridiales bacterium]